MTGMRLNYNALAYSANNNLNAINSNLTKSMERLSSGYKINKASDDPAGKAISQKMQAQIRGLDRATDNANDGISLIQTAEGALNEVHSILARIRELAVKAANETYDATDLDAIQDEITQLQEEIDRIAETTDFNGRKLLNGELNKKGYTNNDNLSIVEIGGDITPGEYGLIVTDAGRQAATIIGVLEEDFVLSEEQAGTLVINDFEIELTKGMTGTEISAAIRDAGSRIGVEYDATTGVLKVEEAGTKHTLTVSSENEQLARLLGVDGRTIYGTNAEVGFMETDSDGKRIGFSESATISAQGNRITVTDDDGFKMVYDVEPESTPGEVTVTVLSAGPMVFQIGSDEGQVVNVNINKTTVEALEIDKINIYTHNAASEAISKVDDAVSRISSIRSLLGAYQNRLEHTVTNLETANENLNSSISRIRDTDMAEEITTYTAQNVLAQSAMQMLVKSNARPEGLLQLFQR